MEKNPDIAKGFTKRDKVLVDSLWQELTVSLNGAGPPNKDVNGWKKIWTEWKSEIKKKLAHNKAEARATGGGPFSKYQLTQTEETIVRLCGIQTTVEGVLGIELGLIEVIEESNVAVNDDMPTGSSRIRPETPYMCSTPKRIRTETTADRLKKFLDEDGEKKREINEKLDQLIAVEKENASALRRIYRAIEKNNESVTKSVNDFKNEFAITSSRILKAMQEKNEIKKQQLQLELMKFELQNKSKAQ
ncbi:uncharacterized protein LOC119601774 [Lucilia sericata]|uniref:uncharacterized protein LOC119601428 n=1 Tax=Lucilia sericata TaxID=13632 RepID=UPI0018A7FB26|nr:uncharacterized protein LOC119601428 [Lucilia sericata]XP_037808847.1 uncharacterized protein LOC119601774 [Lucilia sericata]